jgi:hypothetical protein
MSKLLEHTHRGVLCRYALLILGIYIDSAVEVFSWSGYGHAASIFMVRVSRVHTRPYSLRTHWQCRPRPYAEKSQESRVNMNSEL